MKTLSGILGAITFVLLLALPGTLYFGDEMPHWSSLALMMVICAILSVTTARMARKKE